MGEGRERPVDCLGNAAGDGYNRQLVKLTILRGVKRIGKSAANVKEVIG